MPHMVELPDDLFAKLQGFAVPLIDTPLTVIERALVALEAGDEQLTSPNSAKLARSFNPAAPPSLAFTIPRRASVGGRQLSAGDRYWNSIMYAVIEEAARRGFSTEDLLALISVNSQAGRREDNGFKYLEGANLSIQGQGAAGAWRQSYAIASSVGIAIEVEFAWQDNPKAAMPQMVGTLFIEGELAK